MTSPLSTAKAVLRWVASVIAACTLAAFRAASVCAGTGLTVLPATGADGPATVYYPSNAPDQPITRGPFTLQLALNGPPRPGNGRLIVISHGSGASAWVYNDLAQHLVADGFIVAMPEHAGDNWHDHSKARPESWKLRPLEISRAIDAISQDARFAPLVDTQRVGMWGMSAGGHTALALAGGRWSPARLLAHCEAHLADDFAACTGAATTLHGNGWDGIKKMIVMPLIRWHLRGDDALYGHTDPRVQAIVSGVPVAADFDLATLARPPVPLGSIQAGQDLWLVPKFGKYVLDKRKIEVHDCTHTGAIACLQQFIPPLDSLTTMPRASILKPSAGPMAQYARTAAVRNAIAA